MREKPKDFGRLQHMLEALSNIREFITDINKEIFLTDKLRYFAVVKNLEIVGEAAYMLTTEFRNDHPVTPWKDIIKMRHILVHGYYHLEPEVIWQTIAHDLSPLYNQLILYLEELGDEV